MTPRAAADLLRRRHPALAGASVGALGEGDFYRAFSVDGTQVMRVAKHPAAVEALRREACLLPRLAPLLPLRVPQPIVAFAGDGTDPAFALHPLIPGPGLTRERYLALPETARERCARAVGRFLRALHRTDLALPRACEVPEVDYTSRYAALPERARTLLLPRLPDPLRGWTERALSECLASARATQYRPVLLHGDLSPDHVLFDEEAAEVRGIIDFGDVAIGDSTWDLVYIDEDYGTDFLTRLLPAYGSDRLDVLLPRVRRFRILDAVDWATRCAEEDDTMARRAATGYLQKLRHLGSLTWSARATPIAAESDEP